MYLYLQYLFVLFIFEIRIWKFNFACIDCVIILLRQYSYIFFIFLTNHKRTINSLDSLISIRQKQLSSTCVTLQLTLVPIIVSVWSKMINVLLLFYHWYCQYLYEFLSRHSEMDHPDQFFHRCDLQRSLNIF